MAPHGVLPDPLVSRYLAVAALVIVIGALAYIAVQIALQATP